MPPIFKDKEQYKLPSNAEVKGVGEGSKTGVFGSSEQGWAGYFAGDVGIEKDLHLDGKLAVSGDVDLTGNAHIARNLTIDGSLRTGGEVTISGDAHIIGKLTVDVDIVLTNAQDCAEDFDVDETCIAEPGTVMVVGETGALYPGHYAYDRRVAGVISGAGDFRPGIVLGKQKSESRRHPIALLGKVYCKVDAQYGSVEVGDLLTTSCTIGHAMKASEPVRAFGSVIGKALRPLGEGQGLIPILIALQ